MGGREMACFSLQVYFFGHSLFFFLFFFKIIFKTKKIN